MTHTAPRTVGRPKDLEKRAAILESAGRLFLEYGYERTTVDAIAAAAGVSKLTVYSHFEGKEPLFRALISWKCDVHFGGPDLDHLAELAPEESLTRLASGFVELMFTPDVIAMHRLLMASAAQSPTLVRSFYASGPEPTLTALARLLSNYHRRGLLHVPRPRRAADHFFALLKGDRHFRALLLLDPEPPGARELREHVHDCVGLFLRAYAPRSDDAP